MLWNSVARWISHAPSIGNLSNSSTGRVEAPCWTAPARAYCSRAIRDRFSSASKSTWTWAIEPSGSGTPPCDVPVWIEILLMPAMPAAADERGELGAKAAVRRLLGLVAAPRQIHERRGIHVDVVEARFHRF